MASMHEHSYTGAYVSVWPGNGWGRLLDGVSTFRSSEFEYKYECEAVASYLCHKFIYLNNTDKLHSF